ncbi:FAD-dependent oxidoreductase [Pseudodesulfovibrio sp. zrk46]|uniref:dihydrolipoyl dehydrogenase family protein n=1 Tax=Pseudodesulfovibrio sp. zrk46 TaxID=2725288 RepID=UPI001449E6E0|nr:FAD-dependent oxidoreductase [Pseudodesulfovibrio sp. zrk46]QJB57614.1 FAD-dependent oxidoreductase [Pseudodesulfovibrio sp. zrk46]
MVSFDYDLGIIGGGAAGLTVASGASQLGVKTLLIEKESKLGGDCLHYGCVPSKTLIKTASVYHKMKNAERYGLPKVDLPPIQFSKVAERIQNVIEAIQIHDSVERFCGLGVKVEFGNAYFVDEHTVEFNSKRVSAKFWVIATGSEPAGLPLAGIEDVDYLTNKDLFSLNELPKSMAVLGAGPIACEMAQAFSRLGAEVIILQRSGQILSAEDEDMAIVVQDAFCEEGIDLKLNTQSTAVRKTSCGTEIVYEQGGEAHIICTEKLLIAAGRKPSIESLMLDNAGVKYDLRGIAVDNRMRTSCKHIFAAGDVIGQFKFTHAAGYEASIIISNIVFRLPRKADYTWLPWCTYTEPEFASVGMNEKRAKMAGIEYSVWIEEFSDNDRARAEGASEGRIKLVLDKKEKPLGVQIVGHHAGELVAEWVAALNANTGLTTLASAIHPYPTVSEINKRVAGKVLSRKIFSDKVRKTLSFVFDYKGRACTLD